MSNDNGRIYNSFRNVSTSLLVQVFNLIIVFISRTVFIRTLGVEYLGISGLFTSILTILSLGELGIGEAITFALYKPIKNGETDKINILMNIFRKFYSMTSLIIFIGGIVTLPFLDEIIGSVHTVGNIRSIYLLFIINSSISYLFSYNKILLIADQKAYKTSIVDFACSLLLNLFQIIVLFIFRSYIFYLILQVTFTLLQNIVIFLMTKNEYSTIYRTNIASGSLEKEEKKSLERNIKSLMIQKIGSVTTQGIDNIIITNIISVSTTGLLSNYNLLLNYITKFVNVFFTGISASVGNLVAEGNSKKMLNLFYIIYFSTKVVYSIISIILINVIDDFIMVWIGNEFLLPKLTIYIIVLNFYFMGVRHSINVFKNGLGLYWYDRYKPLISAFINIIFSVILGNIMGITGVLVGTSISLITVNLWIEPYVLFKYGFKTSHVNFIKLFFTDSIKMIITSLIFNFIFSIIEINPNLITIFLKVIVITISMTAYYFFAYRKNKEFEYFNTIFKNLKEKIMK
ncbi:hypothetical protein AAK938_07380 [Aerococcaceae bacterium 50-4]